MEAGFSECTKFYIYIAYTHYTLFTRGLGCILNHSALFWFDSTFIVTYSCIIIITIITCIREVNVLLWCHLIACEMYHCLLCRLLILMQNSRTQYNLIQSSQQLIHKKPYTRHTLTHTYTRDILCKRQFSSLIISKQMRTNGKSCYHRYVIKKKNTRIFGKMNLLKSHNTKHEFYHWTKENHSVYTFFSLFRCCCYFFSVSTLSLVNFT